MGGECSVFGECSVDRESCQMVEKEMDGVKREQEAARDIH